MGPLITCGTRALDLLLDGSPARIPPPGRFARRNPCPWTVHPLDPSPWTIRPPDPSPWTVRSPDLSPCDFFLFGRLKRDLRGRTFGQREALEEEVRRVCHRIIQRDEYTQAMENLLKRWRKCVAVHGDYVEKVRADKEIE